MKFPGSLCPAVPDPPTLICPSCGAQSDANKYCDACGASIVGAPENDEYVGKVIVGKYRVDELIGEGGMGKVYKARQLLLEKPVVLKVLRHSLLSDARTVARFQREAKAASRLNHPNSISILDFGETEDGALYIAMEYVSGRDLHQILSREWPLPEVRVIRIVAQVLSALADAHGASVIHRDLKPENIMVEQRRGEPDYVKVLDFGIAKIIDASADDGPALTRAGFVCGTPEYMSPEQARGAQLDHRSDLYAVGVILYQLTTGLLPFDADSAVGFATKHLSAEPPPPTRRRPEAKISGGMERLILKALAKDPNDRPGSAEAFRQELLALALEKEREPRRPSNPSRRAGVSSPVLAPIPRKVTPEDQADTRVQGQPAWISQERTLVRTKKRKPDTAPGTTTATDPLDDAESRWMKRLVGGLVLASVLLAGWYFAKLHLHDTLAWLSAEAPALPGAVPVAGQPLFERAIPEASRRPDESRAFEAEADLEHQRGRFDLAAAKYKEAFERDPRPELSLKLGEIYFQKRDTPQARGWWARHLSDHRGSRARAYIEARLAIEGE